MPSPSPRARSTAHGRVTRRNLVLSLLAVVIIIVSSFGLTAAANWKPKLGLDLAGGLSVVYRPIGHPSQADLKETVAVLNNRVNALGVSGSEVSTQGTDIVVSAPGVKDARQVLQTVGQTAQLFFRPALCYAPPFVGSHSVHAVPAGAPLPACSPAAELSAANIVSGKSVVDPKLGAWRSTPSIRDLANRSVLLPGLPGAGSTRYLLGPSELSGRAVASAVAQTGPTGAWMVSYTLTGTGSAEWDAVAKANFHQIVGIDLDGVVQSAPVIQPTQSTFTSFGGTGEISGSLTQAQAENLATALNFGALPVRLVPLSTQTISPSLGQSSLVAGLAAGLAGLALVLIYIIFYYRALGLVVVAGLGLTAMLLWVIVSALGHTSLAPSFDLAGVTGLIVSIGITVDSYIVYFERLKDETRSGRSVRTSVDRGFQSAWKTVLAADFVSLLAAVILYLVAIGEVRGFAFFLGLSTLLDVLLTYFFTRPAVILLGRSSRASEGGHFGIARGLAANQQTSEELESV